MRLVMLEGQPFDGWCSHGRIIQPVSRAWAGIIAPRAGRWKRKAVNGLTRRLGRRTRRKTAGRFEEISRVKRGSRPVSTYYAKIRADFLEIRRTATPMSHTPKSAPLMKGVCANLKT